VEYEFVHLKKEDCIAIETETDSFYCFPKNPRAITKLGFATEEIYRLRLAEKRQAPRA
jgi:hypothetical protein